MNYITDYMLLFGVIFLVLIGLIFARAWFKKTPAQIADKQSAKLIAQINKDFERMGRSLDNQERK